MSDAHRHFAAVDEQKRKQRTIFIVFGMLILFVIGLRLKMLPTFNADEFAPLYNQICEELQAGTAFSDEVYQESRKRLRAMGTSPDVLFLFQYVQTVTGKTPLPEKMEQVEAPIREALHAGRFDEAIELIQSAMLRTDAMPAERAEVYARFVREMQRRWDNNCLPIDRAVDELPAG